MRWLQNICRNSAENLDDVAAGHPGGSRVGLRRLLFSLFNRSSSTQHSAVHLTLQTYTSSRCGARPTQAAAEGCKAASLAAPFHVAVSLVDTPLLSRACARTVSPRARDPTARTVPRLPLPWHERILRRRPTPCQAHIASSGIAPTVCKQYARLSVGVSLRKRSAAQSKSHRAHNPHRVPTGAPRIAPRLRRGRA